MNSERLQVSEMQTNWMRSQGYFINLIQLALLIALEVLYNFSFEFKSFGRTACPQIDENASASGAPYRNFCEFLEFAAERSAVSCWVQEIADRTFQELSNGVNFNLISLKNNNFVDEKVLFFPGVDINFSNKLELPRRKTP